MRKTGGEADPVRHLKSTIPRFCPTIDNTGGNQSGVVQRIYVYISSVDTNLSIDIAAFSGSGNVLSASNFAANVLSS